MMKAKHKIRAALFGGLGLLSVVLASLTAHKRGRAHAREDSPENDPNVAGRRVDTYSVAGEEDPGAAVDAPAPPPSPPHAT
jgi:hypothetical protein